MKIFRIVALLSLTTLLFVNRAQSQSSDLKIVLIRHGEKPDKGDNLTCAGFNRSLKLVEVLHQKFGIPNYLYVPAMSAGNKTKHARMFQTITPFAVKYNLAVNNTFEEKKPKALAQELMDKRGTVIVTWEHKEMVDILERLGVDVPSLKWPDNDYDSIWIVTYPKGKPHLTLDRERITPAAGCSF